MRHHPRLFPIIALGSLLLAASALLAQSPSVPAAPKPAKTPIFVDPSRIDLRLILPPPPANDSAATRAELAELHRMEAARTAPEVAAAQFDEAHEDLFLYQNVLGPRFAADKLPLTMTLSLHLRNDAGLLDAPLKKAFGRPRPYNLDKTLHPVCETNQEGSYPSGHALNGYIYSFALEQMVPEKAAGRFALARTATHTAAWSARRTTPLTWRPAAASPMPSSATCWQPRAFRRSLPPREPRPARRWRSQPPPNEPFVISH